VRIIARLLTSEDHLDAMQKMIPGIQYTALLGLASGQSPEEVWVEISQYASHEPVDTKNIVKAMERTPSRVVIVVPIRSLKGSLSTHSPRGGFFSTRRKRRSPTRDGTPVRRR
jgi:hypothetical protein